MNKRGLSTVVTTLIIILLVFVAIGIVWVVVRNVISQGVEQISLGKFTIDLKIKNVDIDNSSNNVTLTVKRNPGIGEITGIKFIFSDGAESETITEDINLKELASKRFDFHLNNLNVDKLKKISIVPIFKSKSGKEIMGEIVDVYESKGGISACIADCTDRVCGSDGCFGSCPPNDCGTGYCASGLCVAGTNPCDLTSASWSQTSVVEGTLVNLNVAGTDCSGIDLNYSIYEDDLIGDTFVTSFVAGLGSTWTAEWMDDGIGQGDQIGRAHV